MKKIIILIAFCVSALYSLIQAQEIYQLDHSAQKYLSLGEINQDTNQYKLLDLKSLAIVWIHKDKLKQQDLFNAEKFYDAILQNRLHFTLEGYAPFWKATIDKNQLMIDTPTLSNNIFSIKIDIDKHPIDSVFLLSFKTHNAEVYGFIRKLTDSTCEIMLTDHALMFEVFINIQGKPYKGCASINHT